MQDKMTSVCTEASGLMKTENAVILREMKGTAKAEVCKAQSELTKVLASPNRIRAYRGKDIQDEGRVRKKAA